MQYSEPAMKVQYEFNGFETIATSGQPQVAWRSTWKPLVSYSKIDLFMSVTGASHKRAVRNPPLWNEQNTIVPILSVSGKALKFGTTCEVELPWAHSVSVGQLEHPVTQFCSFNIGYSVLLYPFHWDDVTLAKENIKTYRGLMTLFDKWDVFYLDRIS